MRKLFYFTSILLITAGMTFAQSDQTTLSGCISKSGDNFVLTDQNGTAYKLDGSGLDAHVGHQASLTGSMGSDNKFKVSDVKMISESCSTTGASATGASTPSSSDNSSTGGAMAAGATTGAATGAATGA